MELSSIFASRSIRVRLSLLIALNSSLALVLAGIGLFGYESIQQRETATRELAAEAGIIAENSTAALNFSDERAATATLTALRGDSRLVEAVIYDQNNRSFAKYHRAGVAPSASLAPRREGVYFENGALLLFRPVRFDGERIGTIFLKSTNEVGARLWRYTGIVFLVFSISLGLSLLLGARTQRSIADPITQLSIVARRVSSEQDYSARASVSATGEIGILVDSFNSMLSWSPVERRIPAGKRRALRTGGPRGQRRTVGLEAGRQQDLFLRPLA